MIALPGGKSRLVISIGRVLPNPVGTQLSVVVISAIYGSAHHISLK